MSKTLLRYPGGKGRAVKSIFSLFPKDITEICSPFFGGGAVELHCVEHGISVCGYDFFKPLVDFWQCVINDAEKLARDVEKYYPLSKDDFYELQRNFGKIRNKRERAAVFFVLNRCSFSGATLSGGMSPGHQRFTPSIINRLRRFRIKNLTVRHADYKDSIKSNKDKFFYLDPPYFISSALYGNKGDMHKDFNHQELFEQVSHLSDFVLSYNWCDEICKMYAGFPYLRPQWKYGMSSDKKSKEIIILSHSLSHLSDHILGEN